MTTLSAKVQLFIIYRCLQLKYDMESYQHQPAPSVLLSFWLVLGYMPWWSDYDYKDWAAPAIFTGLVHNKEKPSHGTIQSVSRRERVLILTTTSFLVPHLTHQCVSENTLHQICISLFS